MDSGRAPSSRPDPDQRRQLDAAQGDLRDAVGGVRNLAQLLQNVRVGPRAVQAVIPDVHGACARIEQVVSTLLDVIAPHLQAPEAIDELKSWMEPRVRELESELSLARNKPVNARQRLHLEHVLLRLSKELEAARQILDLLDDAVRGAPVRVDLAELMREASSTGEQRTGVPVALSPELGGEVFLSPRVAMTLIGIGARIVSEKANSTPALATGAAATDELTLVVRPGPAPGANVVILPAPPLIAPALACALAAARVSDTRLQYDANIPSFTLTWTA